MTEDIIVVREAHALDEAEAMAQRRYSDLPREVVASEDFVVRTDGAEWANHIAPTLRCLAGYRDSGMGTWSVNGEIALIPDGCEQDRPSEALTLKASVFVSDVHKAYRETAYRQYEQQRQAYLADRGDTDQ